jgi:hypothetical protein
LKKAHKYISPQRHGDTEKIGDCWHSATKSAWLKALLRSL